ncbi:MAG: XisH family protein [Caldilineaceae bacterium]
MPARDLYHDIVVHALTLDSWIITEDPLYLPYGGKDVYIDLGAERSPIGAEKNGQKIAVEIKSFLNRSLLHDLEQAVGQYNIYQIVLANLQPERLLYMAVPQRIYENLFMERFGQLIQERLQLRLIVFDEEQEKIVAWIR